MLEQQSDRLLQVRQGMDVYDEQGERIGTVEFVKFGEGAVDLDDTAEITEQAQDRRVAYERQLRSSLLKLGQTDYIPQEIRERMANEGFVRIDTGPLHHDRYVLPEQIHSVSRNRLQIEGTRDGLLKV